MGRLPYRCASRTSLELLRVARELGLRFFNQFLDPERVGLAMAMAGQGIASTGRLDQNVRPNHTGFDVNRGYLADINRHLILAKPGTLAPADGLIGDLDVSGK